MKDNDSKRVTIAISVFFVILFFLPVASIIHDKKSKNKEVHYTYDSDYTYSVISYSKNNNIFENSSTASSSYETSSYKYKSYSPKSKTDDPYNAKDYSNEEDFYDDNYDDFFDYYDAEDYYNEYN